MTFELHYNVYGAFRRPAEDIDLAARAVDAGFEGIWIGDHFHPWIDSRPYAHHVLPWLGSVMEAVPEVPVGTSVSCPTIRYEPPVFAQALATLDNTYPGRLNLGLGTGEAVNEAPFWDGEWPDWGQRAGMLIETIDLMRTLWDADGYVSHDGKYYQYDDIKLATSTREEIPMHWAAWGPQSCTCAGKYAGNLLTVAPPEMIAEDIIPPYEEGLAEAGRDPSVADVTTEYAVNVGDPDEIVAAVREAGEYVPDETELDNPDPRDVQAVADERLAEMSDEDLIDAYTITQDPELVIEELEAFRDAGVTQVLVGSNAGDPYETIELFEEHVIPHFA